MSEEGSFGRQKVLVEISKDRDLVSFYLGWVSIGMLLVQFSAKKKLSRANKLTLCNNWFTFEVGFMQ